MPDEVAGHASDDDAVVIESLTVKHLKEAVEQLPSRERQVLLPHVNSGLTYWEIAGQLGVAEQSVLGDLSHAYSQLRVQLRMDDLHR